MHIYGWTSTCVTAAPPANDVHQLHPTFWRSQIPMSQWVSDRKKRTWLGGASCVSAGEQKESAGTCLNMKIATEIQRMQLPAFLSEYCCLILRVTLIRIYKKE